MISKYYFQLKKDGTSYKHTYCIHPEKIENYEKAMADKFNIWHCHHKKEEFYTQQELIDLGMYYNVPPGDLVFVKDDKEHKCWPHKGNYHSEEARKKLSENCTTKIKVRCIETGQIFDSITAARKFAGLKGTASINRALKKPNCIAGGYHWILL